MTIEITRPIRHLPFEALFNVRDLGGYQGRAGQTLRWQRVYRADALGRGTRADRDALAALGLRTVIDLRTAREVAAHPMPALPGSYVRYHHLPMLRETWDERELVPDPAAPDAAFLAARYLDMLVEGAPAIADALRVLADPGGYPVVFHCSVGKDRTGVLAAVLLALLGAHDETIVDDYAASAPALTAYRSWLDTHDPAAGAALAARPPAFLAAPPAAMAAVLAQVRGEGRSMVGYARSIGVPFEVIESLHDQLLL